MWRTCCSRERDFYGDFTKNPIRNCKIKGFPTAVTPNILTINLQKLSLVSPSMWKEITASG